MLSPSLSLPYELSLISSYQRSSLHSWLQEEDQSQESLMNRGEFQSSLQLQQMIWAGASSSKPSAACQLQQEEQEASPSSMLFSQQQQFNSSGLVHMNSIPSLHVDGNNSLQMHNQSSWSHHLILTGGDDQDERGVVLSKGLENWEAAAGCMVGMKEEAPAYSSFYGHLADHHEIQAKSQLSQMLLQASSPRSCVTTSLGSNMLDFSNSAPPPQQQPPPPPEIRSHHHNSDNSSECNSTATGSSLKKARVQASSSAQSTLKVRKERLGDRITALHQIVSPFGKTDTASVLQETIGYVRFLLSQIEALSYPYMGHGNGTTSMQNGAATGERNTAGIFPEYPGQLLNQNNNSSTGAAVQQQQAASQPEQQQVIMSSDEKELRSRGLCLVPVSCTAHLGGDNAADYWAPAPLGGILR